MYAVTPFVARNTLVHGHAAARQQPTTVPWGCAGSSRHGKLTLSDRLDRSRRRRCDYRRRTPLPHRGGRFRTCSVDTLAPIGRYPPAHGSYRRQPGRACAPTPIAPRSLVGAAPPTARTRRIHCAWNSPRRCGTPARCDRWPHRKQPPLVPARQS